MKPETNSLDPKIDRRLAAFKAAPAPEMVHAAEKRAAYLAKLETLPAALPASQQTTGGKRWAGMNWKERKMMPLITAFVVIFALVLGGGGVTLAAAQESLPGEALYPVKQWTEEMQLNLAGDEQTQFDLQFDFTNRRFDELNTLVSAGDKLPDTLGELTGEQLANVFTAADGLEVAAQTQALVKLQLALEKQSQIMAAGDPTEPVMAQVRSTVEEHIRLATLGLEDPEAFHVQIQDRDRDQLHTNQPAEIGPNGTQAGPGGDQGGAGTGPGDGTPQCTPMGSGAGTQAGPQGGSGGGNGQGGSQQTPAATPMGTQAGPQAGNGQGDGTPQCTNECTPVGTQAGPQPGNGSGGGGQQGTPSVTPVPPDPTGEPPTPDPSPTSGGSGYGPGPDPSQTPGSGGSGNGQGGKP